ncbi:hypothetical protein TNCV_2641651 [Trichonephila clavipes]|nr:hypothetical protein TNCV_2641651 [Trichonephila clavipes]
MYQDRPSGKKVRDKKIGCICSSIRFLSECAWHIPPLNRLEKGKLRHSNSDSPRDFQTFSQPSFQIGLYVLTHTDTSQGSR